MLFEIIGVINLIGAIIYAVLLANQLKDSKRFIEKHKDSKNPRETDEEFLQRVRKNNALTSVTFFIIAFVWLLKPILF